MTTSRKLLLWFVVFVIAGFAQYKNERKFSLSRIAFQLPEQEEPEEISFDASLLEKPFTYLASGSQMVAFVSQDGKSVLKFFKNDHLVPKAWLNKIPLPRFLESYRYRKTTAREERCRNLFAAQELAYRQFREESGLLYVHLKKSRSWSRSVVVIDKRGKRHTVDLHATPFILQKRAEKIYDRWSRLLQKQKWNELQTEIQQMAFFIESRSRRGIADRDSGISQNFGFIDGRLVQIDVGAFYPSEEIKEEGAMKKEQERVIGKINDWIKSEQSRY